MGGAGSVTPEVQFPAYWGFGSLQRWQTPLSWLTVHAWHCVLFEHAWQHVDGSCVFRVPMPACVAFGIHV